MKLLVFFFLYYYYYYYFIFYFFIFWASNPPFRINHAIISNNLNKELITMTKFTMRVPLISRCTQACSRSQPRAGRQTRGRAPSTRPPSSWRCGKRSRRQCLKTRCVVGVLIYCKIRNKRPRGRYILPKWWGGWRLFKCINCRFNSNTIRTVFHVV